MSGSGYPKGGYMRGAGETLDKIKALEQANEDLRTGKLKIPRVTPAESYIEHARGKMIEIVKAARDANNAAAADAMSEALDALDEVCRCIKRSRDAGKL